MGKLSQKEKENALNEVRILASITTETIVAYKEAFFEDLDEKLKEGDQEDKGEDKQSVSKR